MKESRAWEIVAKEFDTLPHKGHEFLCNLLLHSYPTNPKVAALPLALRGKMVDRIADAMDPGYGAAYRDMESDTHDARVLACLMFSQVAADEEFYATDIVG